MEIKLRDKELTQRLKDYAKEKEVEHDEAVETLLTLGLDTHEARVRGGKVLQKRRTKAERSEAARKAVQTRWERVKKEAGRR